MMLMLPRDEHEQRNLVVADEERCLAAFLWEFKRKMPRSMRQILVQLRTRRLMRAAVLYRMRSSGMIQLIHKAVDVNLETLGRGRAALEAILAHGAEDWAQLKRLHLAEEEAQMLLGGLGRMVHGLDPEITLEGALETGLDERTDRRGG